MKHIISFSKGHSSALVAIEVVRKYGKDDVILLNNGINPNVENVDIKRFGYEVATYLGIPITFVNYKQVATEEEIPDQFDIALELNAFKVPNSDNALCSNELKIEPTNAYLRQTFPMQDCVIYYGFDPKEIARKARREAVMGRYGWDTAYPLIDWERTINSTLEIGIDPPLTYAKTKHANCDGCLKAGLQHWYVVYCNRPDIWEKAKETEKTIGYAILKREKKGKQVPTYLIELEETFRLMKCNGVPDSEHFDPAKFKSYLKYYGLAEWSLFKPCECSF